jgi:hypothetical protein
MAPSGQMLKQGTPRLHIPMFLYNDQYYIGFVYHYITDGSHKRKEIIDTSGRQIYFCLNNIVEVKAVRKVRTCHST